MKNKDPPRWKLSSRKISKKINKKGIIQMKKLKDKIYGNVIATDDVPIFSVSSRIIEEKISLHLLGAHYSGTLGKYMEPADNRIMLVSSFPHLYK